MDMAASRKKAQASTRNDELSRIDPERRLLKAPEVARQLGLARSTVYQMMSLGEIATVRRGRAVRVPISAVDEWIARQTRAGSGNHGPRAA
jgi:excisionase family DNA binding protein